MREDLRFRRLLARATFGARPGELARLTRTELPRGVVGVAGGWIEAQLDAARAPDPDLDRRLAAFPSLALEPADLAEEAPTTRRGGGMLMGGDTGRMQAVRERSRRIAQEVVGARLVRAVHARAGLREVMVDFWSNHFNVFGRKPMVGALLPHYQRDVLDAFALGRFEDLLLAVAKSPAMLIYLDNWRSVAPQRNARRRSHAFGRSIARRAGRGGINENYARELLELHTLGVNGGYTQNDVTEVARVFTGWSLASLRAPEFEFHARLHDPGRKNVMGERTEGRGVAEGENLLRRLAHHPQTAHHIATALVRRFVADSPPKRLVAETARRFAESGGLISEVLKGVLLSPEFADPANIKLKTPLRFAVSALRATAGETDGGPAVLRELGRLGELPFFARTPAGFPEDSASWIDPGALLERMSLASALASGHIRGAKLGTALPEIPIESSEKFADASLGLTHPERVALVLASPDFQWA